MGNRENFSGKVIEILTAIPLLKDGELDELLDKILLEKAQRGSKNTTTVKLG